MTNTELLRKKIEERGLKIYYIADKLNLSNQGLSNKFENKSEFKVSEVAILKALLDLTEDEVQEIFFAAEVAL